MKRLFLASLLFMSCAKQDNLPLQINKSETHEQSVQRAILSSNFSDFYLISVNETLVAKTVNVQGLHALADKKLEVYSRLKDEFKGVTFSDPDLTAIFAAMKKKYAPKDRTSQTEKRKCKDAWDNSNNQCFLTFVISELRLLEHMVHAWDWDKHMGNVDTFVDCSNGAENDYTKCIKADGTEQN